MKKIIVIAGQTSSGKTGLSIKIAKMIKNQKLGGFNGAEIISADSRQVYKGMNIGSGKITKKEMAGVPHHLLDVASPKRQYTVAQFKKKALAAIKKIHRRGKVPFLVGGTGFYIKAVADNMALPEVKPDKKLREKMEKKTVEELFLMLKKLDQKRAETIDSKNKRRLIRALEIIKKTGKPVAPLQLQKPEFEVLKIGLKKEEKELKQRIKARLKKRIRQGMINEVKKLKKSGLSWKRLEDFGLEYRYIALFLQKKISREEMLYKIQKESERFAKRQMTWFKKDKDIIWVKNEKEAKTLIKKFLRGRAL